MPSHDVLQVPTGRDHHRYSESPYSTTDDSSSQFIIESFNPDSDPPSSTLPESPAATRNRRVSKKSSKAGSMRSMMSVFRVDAFSYQDGIHARSSKFARPDESSSEAPPTATGHPTEDEWIDQTSDTGLEPLLFTFQLRSTQNETKDGDDTLTISAIRSSASPSPQPVALSLPSQPSVSAVDLDHSIHHPTFISTLTGDPNHPQSILKRPNQYEDGNLLKRARTRGKQPMREEDLAVLEEPVEWHRPPAVSPPNDGATFDFTAAFPFNSDPGAFSRTDFGSLSHPGLLDIHGGPGFPTGSSSVDYNNGSGRSADSCMSLPVFSSGFITSSSSLAGAIPDNFNSSSHRNRDDSGSARDSTTSNLVSDTVVGSSPSHSKKHACTVPGCNRVFPRPSGLATHMNVHSGAKPYECPIPGCKKMFNVRSNARRHLRTHGYRVRPKREDHYLHKRVESDPEQESPASQSDPGFPASHPFSITQDTPITTSNTLTRVSSISAITNPTSVDLPSLFSMFPMHPSLPPISLTSHSSSRTEDRSTQISTRTAQRPTDDSLLIPAQFQLAGSPSPSVCSSASTSLRSDSPPTLGSILPRLDLNSFATSRNIIPTINSLANSSSHRQLSSSGTTSSQDNLLLPSFRSFLGSSSRSGHPLNHRDNINRSNTSYHNPFSSSLPPFPSSSTTPLNDENYDPNVPGGDSLDRYWKRSEGGGITSENHCASLGSAGGEHNNNGSAGGALRSGTGIGNRREREPWAILQPARWRPKSLDPFKNAPSLSSTPPFDDSGKFSLVTIPMQPRKPSCTSVREEERNSYESTGAYPYHPSQWSKLPGPAPLLATELLTNSSSPSWA